jgi:hypothetical protein
MITDFAANQLIGLLTSHVASVTFGPDIYVGLSSTEPTILGTNVTEPTVNGYARSLLGYYDQSMTLKMNVPASGSSSSKDIIFMHEVTDTDNAYGWVTSSNIPLTHLVIYDAPVGGNLLVYQALTDSILPVTGDVPLIRAGALTISIH